jgi:2-polyprenyl-6-hydroxyphenyl methylase/3-demethylubiquinone-9 3-methyltransferase
MVKKHSTVDHDEVSKFSKIADQWWDETGEYAMLHKINPVRIAYLRDHITKHLKKLKGLKILDVGCGGGLVSLPLARLGGEVTAIDASAENIKAARVHAQAEGIKVNYQNIAAEDLADKNNKFDVVIALEIIEHVADVELFIQSLTKLLKPHGLLFISTINRTMKAKLLAKIMAEYVLRWVPVGTHDFAKFITPAELTKLAGKYQLHAIDFTGMIYRPLSKTWELNPNKLDINYLSCFKLN